MRTTYKRDVHVMNKKTMHRSANDSTYLHKDFHGALSCGIEYLHQNFGATAVRDYLHQFARVYYASLTESLQRRGLVVLENYFRELYATEGVAICSTLTDDELRIEIDACPAVTHMRTHNYPVARLWHETTNTVNRAICLGTPFQAELVEYVEETGRSVIRFYRRKGNSTTARS